MNPKLKEKMCVKKWMEKVEWQNFYNQKLEWMGQQLVWVDWTAILYHVGPPAGILNKLSEKLLTFVWLVTQWSCTKTIFNSQTKYANWPSKIHPKSHSILKGEIKQKL